MNEAARKYQNHFCFLMVQHFISADITTYCTHREQDQNRMFVIILSVAPTRNDFELPRMYESIWTVSCQTMRLCQDVLSVTIKCIDKILHYENHAWIADITKGHKLASEVVYLPKNGVSIGCLKFLPKKPKNLQICGVHKILQAGRVSTS